MNLFMHAAGDEDVTFLGLVKDLAIGNAIALFGVIFAVIILANVITYKLSKKDNEIKDLGVVGGALLGLVPGCGGTIAVASMYKKKRASFAALTAAFIATLGEGSFILLATIPEAFLPITLTAFTIAIAVGFAIVKFAPDLHKLEKNKKVKGKSAKGDCVKVADKPRSKFVDDLLSTYLFWPLAVLGTIFAPLSVLGLTSGIVQAIKGEDHGWEFVEHMGDNPIIAALAITAMIVAAIYWIVDMRAGCKEDCSCTTNFKEQMIHGVRDAAMIISYIMIATIFVGYSIELMGGEGEMIHFLEEWGFGLVILAAFFGVIPGCAALMAVFAVVAAIHGETGEMMWAVLLTATLASSGDGIFGLLAIDRKAAFKISVISVIVALTVGIPVYFLIG